MDVIYQKLVQDRQLCEKRLLQLSNINMKASEVCFNSKE